MDGNLKKVVLFAGTVEGRMLSEWLSKQEVMTTACVATEYGETLLKEGKYLHVHAGRMDEEQMAAFLKEEAPLLVVDATHPYAQIVSANIHAACNNANVEYLRLVRESEAETDATAICVNSVDEAVEYLKTVSGNVLATTGSKELHKYTTIPDYQNRVFARVLSTAEVAAACEKLGFKGKNLICMQGPFSEELNTAMLRQFDCRFLITKETGKAGGFGDKIRAARKAGAKVVLVGRPAEQEGGMSYDAILQLLTQRLYLTKRNISLVGIGMGTATGMTREAWEVVKDADLLIGAGRMLKACDGLGKPKFDAYDPKLIKDIILQHENAEKTAILLSGDIGFYSGAKRLYEALSDIDAKIESYPGISSVVYFCTKLRTSWEDTALRSTHGRSANLVGTIKANKKTFTLLSAKDSVRELTEQLIEYGLADVTVHIGERLGYPQEKITSGTPSQLKDGEYDSLCVALIENPNADSAIMSCIDDEAFLRGKAPMTKSEIRSLSVAKLKLPKEAVVYDVGAGTGSVTIEMALQAMDGQVYAIERNEEACGLIEENKRRFGTPNIHVVHGLAPEAMEDLPVPTHAFIGGSAGNLKEILECLLKKNPKIRIVINTVTLETIAEVTSALKELPLIEEETISVSVAKAKLLGNYHLMMGQNPIYIITCRGGEEV